MHPIPTNLLLTVASLCIGGIPGRSLGDGFSPDNIILAFVPPGEFLSGDNIPQRCEQPRIVTLTRPFGIGTHEITNAQYVAGLEWALDAGLIAVTEHAILDASGEAPPHIELLDLDDPDCEIEFRDGAFHIKEATFALLLAYPDGYDPSDHPVKKVSWYGAASYCNWLSIYTGREPAYDPDTWACGPGGDVYEAEGFRLPTEAEWEYAAQFDDERSHAWGNKEASCERANYWPDTRCTGWTIPVGLQPLGQQTELNPPLYDLAGNVWEWCHDGWVCTWGNAPVSDPVGPERSPYRAVRGGAWGADDLGMRISIRMGVHPVFSSTVYGFRIARTM